jgi:hypothetical protein
MPRARVTASITTGGQRTNLFGVGYHDHNWGNTAPASILDHWYWGHAHLADYTFVALRAVSHAKYGNRVFPALLFARGREILAQRTTAFDFSAVDESVEPTTGVPLAGRLVYQVDARAAHYRLEFTRSRDVLAFGFGEARGYLRFVGDVRMERSAGAAEPEVTSGSGLWEILSFGSRQTASGVSAQ